MKRLFDFCLATCATILLAVPISVVALLVKLTSQGPILYWSNRIGRSNRVFRMPKFRSMRIDTRLSRPICLVIRMTT
ncbi:sugar transferase [Propionivibrio sp.]|uniref:sugar transferase n=1 Tax=Propionivibrio sp. TaxID=2212460 RepID=UPI0025D9CD0D|nr:sugar transferase [Propionivibrio sp.]